MYYTGMGLNLDPVEKIMLFKYSEFSYNICMPTIFFFKTNHFITSWPVFATLVLASLSN